MKVIRLLFLVGIFLSKFNAFANETSVNIAKLIPKEAQLVVSFKSIEKMLSLINLYKNNILTNEQYNKINLWNNNFKANTGSSLIIIDDLIALGLDDKLPVSIVRTEKDNNLIIYLPVNKEKNFNLNFVNLLQKNNPEILNKLYPALNKYKNKIIYQILNDIFYVEINNYFIVSQNIETIKKIINMSVEESKENIVSNRYYKKFHKEYENKNNISIYAKPSLINSYYNEIYKTNNSKSIEKLNEINELNYFAAFINNDKNLIKSKIFICASKKNKISSKIKYLFIPVFFNLINQFTGNIGKLYNPEYFKYYDQIALIDFSLSGKKDQIIDYVVKLSSNKINKNINTWKKIKSKYSKNIVKNEDNFEKILSNSKIKNENKNSFYVLMSKKNCYISNNAEYLKIKLKDKKQVMKFKKINNEILCYAKSDFHYNSKNTLDFVNFYKEKNVRLAKFIQRIKNVLFIINETDNIYELNMSVSIK